MSAAVKIGRPSRPLAERLNGRVTVDFRTGCWIWIGLTNREGYGIVHAGGVEGGQRLRAHRAVYELMVGPIPEGLTLDHLCRTRNCVNPEHLEPVTRAENVRRGFSISVVNAAKTHCPRGHEYTPENTFTRKRGGRECRICVYRRNRARYLLKKRVSA